MAGSDNLEEVFEENLKRIGQVVAVLDRRQRPFFKTSSFEFQDKVGSFLHVFSYASNISYLVMCRWQEPVYLQRVWTIYEQYVACSLEIPVTFVMPEDATVPWVLKFCIFVGSLYFLKISAKKKTSAQRSCHIVIPMT